MTDPKEKPVQEQQEEKKFREPAQQDGSNWQENQRIDEEGNELAPEDVK